MSKRYRGRRPSAGPDWELVVRAAAWVACTACVIAVIITLTVPVSGWGV